MDLIVKLSIGVSTTENSDELFAAYKQADSNMYVDKEKRHSDRS